MGYVYLLAAIITEVIGTSFLKAADGFANVLPTLVTLAAYACAFFFLSLTLRTVPVGIAYATWSGIGIVLIALIGAILLGQTLDLPAILGMGLIIIGVVVVNMFSKSTVH